MKSKIPCPRFHLTSAISLNVSTLKRNLEDPKFLTASPVVIAKEVAEILDFTRQYVGKIDNIICHLSDLAHSKPLTIQDGIQPRTVAEKAIQMLKKNVDGSKINIRNEISPNLTIVCDPDALHEILVNLIRNAEQATADDGEIILKGTVLNGGTTIFIRDTGIGIPRDSRVKIFEPFYTTKRKKQTSQPMGSGMGLFIVRQLMQGMGGHIDLISERGRGSEFRLHFPSLEPAIRRAA